MNINIPVFLALSGRRPWQTNNYFFIDLKISIESYMYLLFMLNRTSFKIWSWCLMNKFFLNPTPPPPHKKMVRFHTHREGGDIGLFNTLIPKVLY